MNNTLIHKYKPKFLNEINMDKNNIKIIQKLIENNFLSTIIHGSCGSGKTSLISVIVNEYFNNNVQKYSENIINITLLKDQGINFYKNDLKNFCNSYCSNSYKKFVIIEDIELFSEQVIIYFYNLIIKYKESINFILSTNDLLKINNNIIDILDVIHLKEIDYNILNKILEKIIINEKLTLNSDIKEYIINISNYSIANLINNIEKFILLDNNNLNLQDILKLDIESNIIVSDYSIFVDLCKQKNKYKATNYLLNLYNKGYSVIDILVNLLYYLKNIENSLNENNKFLIIKLIIRYINNFHIIHEDEIELIFFTNNIINIII
jgi:DNA polymerase III delta prime subunit